MAPETVIIRPVIVDPECYELAQAFLRDSDLKVTELRVSSLAAAIQQAVENWFEDRPVP